VRSPVSKLDIRLIARGKGERNLILDICPFRFERMAFADQFAQPAAGLRRITPDRRLHDRSIGVTGQCQLQRFKCFGAKLARPRPARGSSGPGCIGEQPEPPALRPLLALPLGLCLSTGRSAAASAALPRK
jgi:hypothetical protein